jgi:hypothetical protein
VVGRETLCLFQVGAVDVVCESSHLDASLDEFVDGGIHLELQKCRHVDIAF